MKENDNSEITLVAQEEPKPLNPPKPPTGLPTKKLKYKQEIIKCGKDPIYFINNYAKIQHPKKGLVKFKLFPYQEDLIRAYTDHRNNVVLKARQLGISAVTAAYVAWLVLFYRHKSVLIVSTKLSTAKNLIKKIKVIYDYLPKWMFLCRKVEDNVHSVAFDNGSWVKSVAKSKDVGRSEALSLLVIDEAAHIEGFDDIWVGLAPTVSLGGKIFVLSTPLGVGNQFYKLYQHAHSGEDPDWNCMVGDKDKLMWWEHPEHDEKWFKKETMNKDTHLINQEYLCGFLQSGETYFNPMDISWLAEAKELDNFNNLFDRVRDPQSRLFDGNFWIWKDPEYARQYIITADPSRGDSSDYSAAMIMDAIDCEVVAEYRGKCPPDIFADFLVEQAKRYNNALLAIENNAIGAAVLLKIKGTKYHNLYFMKRKNNLDFTDPMFTYYDNGFTPGFTMNQNTRPVVLAKLEEYIRNRLLVTHSSRFIAECETFVFKSGRPEAMKGYNDDLIMAHAIGVFLRDTSKAYMQTGEQWNAVLATGIIRDTTANPLISRTKTGMAGLLDRGKVETFDPRTNKIRIGTNEIIDLNHLLIK